MKRSVQLLLTAVACSAPAAGQAELRRFDLRQVVTFGDSLTDTDLGGRMKRIDQLRFGVDPIEHVFCRARSPGDRLTNFAAAGARCVDLRDQLACYARARLDGSVAAATLISYQGGVNDVFEKLPLLSAIGPGFWTNVCTDWIAGRLLGDVAALAAAHPGAHFVVWTIPDVSSTPRFASLPPQQQLNLRLNVNRINNWLRRLEAVHPSFLVLDLEVLFYHYARNPRWLEEIPLLPLSGVPGALFGDPVHPSAVFNAILANALIDRMNARWRTSIPRYSDRELAAIARAVAW